MYVLLVSHKLLANNWAVGDLKVYTDLIEALAGKVECEDLDLAMEMDREWKVWPLIPEKDINDWA